MSIKNYLWDKPGYDIKAHLAHVQKLYDAYPLRTVESQEQHLTKYVSIIFKDGETELLEPITKCFTDLLFENEVYRTSFKPIEDRDYLIQQEKKLDPTRIDPLTQSLGGYFLYLARLVPITQKSNLTVPLHSLIPDLRDVVHATLQTFSDLYLLETASQLGANLMECSGIDDPSKKKTYPKDYKGDPLDYLVGTPLYELFCTQVPFAISREKWAEHGIILAPPGHGKTQLLGSLLASFLNMADQPGLFVLDPHGDLFGILAQRCSPDRLVILDPDSAPPPLNFLDFGNSTEANTLQTFSYLMSSLSGGLSDKQGAIVPYLLKLLRQIPNASLETLRLIVDEKVKAPDRSVFADYIKVLPQVDQGFFHNQFYTPRMQETKDSIGWKLYSALSSDAFRQMFSAKTNSFDADAAMRDRKVVLVKGARGSLGDAGMTVFLQFIVAQFFAAALRRESMRPNERKLCLLFVDEAHHVFNSQTANILTECRKYGLGLISATQVIQQIPEDVKHAIYGATAIKIAGPVSHNDASILSREMYTSTEFIRSMKAIKGKGANWVFHVKDVTDQAVKVFVPYGQLEAMPKLAAPLVVRNVAAIVSSAVHAPSIPPKAKGGPSKPEPPPVPTPSTVPQSPDGRTSSPGGWGDDDTIK